MKHNDNKTNNNNIHIKKKNFIISIIIVTVISIILLTTSILSSSLLPLSPTQVKGVPVAAAQSTFPNIGADCSNPSAAREKCKQDCSSIAQNDRDNCRKITNGKAQAGCLAGITTASLICKSSCSNICSNCPAGATKPIQCTYNSCVDVAQDTNNCGVCGNVCHSSVSNSIPVCTNGQCSFECNPGYKLSNGQCIQCPAGSDANCQCPAGEHLATGFNRCEPDCTGGKINDPQTGACTCPAGEMDCGGECVDTLNNDLNCGSCGNVCNGGQECQTSQCQCPPDKPHLINGQCQQCPQGQVPGTGADEGKCVRDCAGELGGGYQYCSNWGQCVNTDTTNTDCGACGNKCDPGLSCIGGSCSPTVPLCQPLIIDGQQVGCQNCGSGNNILCASCISVVSSCS